ncbi:hypothetical protein A2702_00230 [Candidatus Amesbacteria bacterium RIFCSPHIGHO2_01_FULL_48_75]|nr:MAG: hypothetical protein A2702_00230 [Candidatus Amesbacteria bacterium RIFCSPHIGHO2_01_FULL_48_75]OGD06602.1 MAG: hypothetical protein A3B58_02455 [Candidatus Amesbacteria bacterium RIFCSPLOWO2_01_FULL_48_50]
MSIKAETIAGVFVDKVMPESGQPKFLGYDPETQSGIYSSMLAPRGLTRTTQYPTSPGQWDQDEQAFM